MKLTIVVVTPRKEAYDLVEGKAKAIASSNVTKKGYLAERNPTTSIVGFLFQDEKAEEQLTSRILSFSERSDAIILVADGKKTMEAVAPLREALHCFQADFSFVHEEKTSENFLRAIISDAVSEFAKFTSFFNDHKYEKIFLLPTKIFRMEAWRKLVAISTKEISLDNSVDEIQGCIKSIRNKMSPKRLGDIRNRVQYFVDENDFFYAYGHERHARPETKTPPHSLTCGLNSRFRFGRRYDDERHFNVSVERPKSPIAGEFTTCHGQIDPHSSETHLNIFPNNHIA